jgi:hypothetical protein
MAAAGAVWNRTGVVSNRESDRVLHAMADSRKFRHRRPRSAQISASDSLQRKHDVTICRQNTWLVIELTYSVLNQTCHVVIRELKSINQYCQNKVRLFGRMMDYLPVVFTTMRMRRCNSEVNQLKLWGINKRIAPVSACDFRGAAGLWQGLPRVYQI